MPATRSKTRKGDEVETLLRLAHLAASAETAEAVLQAAGEALSSLSGADGVCFVESSRKKSGAPSLVSGPRDLWEEFQGGVDEILGATGRGEEAAAPVAFREGGKRRRGFCLGVPVSGEARGAFLLFRRRRRAFSKRQRRLAAGIAAQATTGIRLARMRESAGRTRSQLEAVVECSEDAIYLKTLDGVITSWNRGAEELYGYGKREIVGKSVALLVPEDRRQELDQILSRVRAGRGIKQLETVRLRADGSRVHISLSVSPLRNPAGRVTAASTIARDITHRKQAEEERAIRSRKVRKITGEIATELDPRELIESVCRELDWVAGEVWQDDPESGRPRPLAAWVRPGSSAEKVLRDSGEGAESMVGEWPRRFRSSKIPIWIPDVGRDPSFPRAEAARRAGLRTAVGVPIRKGEEVWAVLLFFKDEVREPEDDVLDSLTMIAAYAGIALERSRAVGEVSQQEELVKLGEATASAAHELKNPLASIRGPLEIMARRMPREDARREMLEEVVDQTNRLNRIVGRILDFARKVKPSKSRCDLRSLISGIEAEARRDEDFHGVALEVEGPAEVPARVDESLMKQVLWNLFLNAGQAMGGRGAVRVCLRPSATRLWVEIADDGPGIPERVRERIFQPFFTTKTKGTGLGLPLCRKIMQAHEGDIKIECPAGAGTVVTLDLPLDVPEPGAPSDR